MKQPKPKKCKACGEEFMPGRSTQQTCYTIECALKLTAMKKTAKLKREHAVHKKAFYGNDRPYQLRLAQVAFNAFIRYRDKAQPCISCGRYHTGQNHAGHYRSVGAAPQLRFNQFNVNLQCSVCNNYKSGNQLEYRINLIKKFGVDKVEELESANDPLKFSLDEVVAIKEYFRKLLKAIKEA